MKKKLSTRIFSIFLAVLMAVSIIPAGAITASAASNDYLHWAQTDSRWGSISIAADNHSSCTMGKYGCWITAYDKLLIQSGKKGQDFTPASMTTWLKNNRLLSNEGYLVGNHPKTIANAFGLTYVGRKTANNFNAYNDLIKNYVNQNCYVLIRWGKGSGSHTSIVDNALTKANNYTITSNSWSNSNYNVRLDSASYTNRYGRNIVFIDVFKGDGNTVINVPPSNNTYYNSNVKKTTGTYINTCNSGVNMRSGVGTGSAKVGCTVPKNAEIYVYETDGNWGKITFANHIGWVCLDYFTKVSIPVPATPSISSISSENIAVGKSVTINWNSVSGADNYTVGIRSNHVNQDINVGNSTSYSYTLSYSEKYDFYVRSSNVSGSSNWSSAKSCTAHDPVTVSFVDWDGSMLGSQTIDYGASAVAPSAPERKGYTFQGWSDSFYNVTSNKTIKATYKINTYIVNFFDREGTLISSQKVTYGSDATPPSDTHENDRYKFVGWNSTDYIDVYTDRADKNINIDGIYTWYNYDLPTVCTITSATRQYDGYYVTFDIENNDSMPTTGRAVVALKTAEGKLVEMTESTAFSIPAGKEKNSVEVFIPCNKVASSIEVFMVDDYSSGIPISPSVTSEIEEGLMYAESTVKPDNSDGTLDIQEVTQYSYRDKEFSTGNTKTKDGWNYTGTRTEQAGSWSSWGWNYIGGYDNESQRREVQTQSAIKSYNYKTVWNYYRWAKQYSGGYGNTYQTSNHPNYYEYTFDSELAPYASGKYKWWYSGSNYCVVYPRNPYTSQVQTSANYATQYRYRDINYIYNFYRWKNWTDWSDTQVTATENRDVRTRTIYRYKSNNIQPEDNSGQVRTINGSLDSSFAGKQITLYVFGYTGASDYTNEYIGQSVVGEDGSYSFTFKLREEPSVNTGDFTVAIGIEGTTNLTVIDTIEAPVPTYEVNFYDWDGSIISTQTVKEGENAVLPENPEKEGYDFIGWDKSVANIKENTDFFADFKKKTCTVIFVDWQNQQIEVKNFDYGDALVAPETTTVEGYTFSGWDNDSTVVTQDMIVTAQYEANEYTIKFYDWNNNVISTQTVNYGETAVVPDDPEEDGIIFADWFNPEDYQNVDHDAAIYPTYYFEETTPNPSANLSTGEYDDEIRLELSCEDENAVIFYYVDGDESTEAIYTEPVTIDKTSSVTFYATSLGKNDSEKQTNYYCINSSDKPSDWMIYSDLPQDVTENQDDYILESETGYRFKDITSTSDKTKVDELNNAGWTLNNTTYTDYTEWQDEPITVDDSLLGFEVDTRETDDNTVTRYQYSHYSYVNGDGVTQYSPKEVDGYDCKYEEIVLDSRLTIAGFLEDNTSYYNHDGQRWFTQVRVPGVKTQYRSRYQVAEYYKWTSWGTDAPAIDESRDYETDDIYRYTNKKYHIVFVNSLYSAYFVEDGKTVNTNLLDNVEGYNFAGLYKDEELTNQFEINTPITESITLFTKYTPKEYTVIFQMQDETELDVQKVEYMQAATPPATDVVPGYVFGGWDKDFSCITEDTVITGTYFKESEYARISLDRSKAELYQGSSITLIPTITPSNLSDEPVEWSSSDPGIASVDDTGRVTAVSAGSATITVKVLKTRETATCEVTVDPDKNNFIILKSDSSLNYDELGYLRRIDLNTTVDEIKDQFTNDELYFYDINGNVLDDEDTIGTGTQIKLYNGEEVVDTKTVVITGDMTGDGLINNRDVAMMNKTLIGTVEAEEFQMLAIDVNGDGSVNNRDAAMVARYLVGKDTF